MRFLVMVQMTPEVEAGLVPTKEAVQKMGVFNDALVRDGVMLEAEGLRPSSEGARITYTGEKPVVTDGPFTESKELVVGFWIMQGRSREEIIERMKQCPFEQGESVEIRPIFEMEDFERALVS